MNRDFNAVRNLLRANTSEVMLREKKGLKENERMREGHSRSHYASEASIESMSNNANAL